MGKISRIVALLLTLTILMSCLTLLTVEPVNAQTSQPPTLEWSKTYGPYMGFSITQTNDGGYAIACQNATHEIHGYNRYRPLVIKTDSEGNSIWQTEIPNIVGWATSIVQTTDLGYAIGCQPNGAVVKLDEQGHIQWEYALGYAGCRVSQTTDGNYIIAGNRENTDTGGYETFLYKLNRDGGFMWGKPYRFGYIDLVTTFVETPDGGYAFSGQTTGWFAKTDSNGNLLWNQTFVAPSTGNAIDFTSIANDDNDSFVLAGFDSYVPAGSDIRLFTGYLLKTDSMGNAKSTYQYSNCSIQSIVKAPFGYVAIGAIDNQNRLFGIDYMGEILWTVKIPANPYCVALTKDNSYVVTGYNVTAGVQDYTIWAGKFTYPLPSPTPTIPTPTHHSGFPPENPTSVIVVIVSMVIVAVGIIFLMCRRHRKTANLSK
jgi:hypothetical protein